MKRVVIRLATAAALLAATLGGIAIYGTATAPAAHAEPTRGGGYNAGGH
jgi:hypothetical protein